MNPFYSVEDLADLFDFHTPRNVADALRAAGVLMIYNGEEADLTQWKRISRSRNESGALVVVRGFELEPDPDEVMVSYESLPASWKAAIDGEAQPDPEIKDGKIDPRREKSLLRIIRALDVMADLPIKGAATSVTKQLEELGFSSPQSERVAQVISAARALHPDE